jgi:hypothetical protein
MRFKGLKALKAFFSPCWHSSLILAMMVKAKAIRKECPVQFQYSGSGRGESKVL